MGGGVVNTFNNKSLPCLEYVAFVKVKKEHILDLATRKEKVLEIVTQWLAEMDKFETELADGAEPDVESFLTVLTLWLSAATTLKQHIERHLEAMDATVYKVPVDQGLPTGNN